MAKRRIESPSAPPETKRPRVCEERQYDTIYEPLPAGEFIRVLKLQPGDNNQDIDCSLEIVDIEQSKGSYEAISYVWGDPNDTVDVQCNGQRVPITVSLSDALRNFRHTSEPRVLWADALCINQEDKKEKGHQVKRMGEVYANAKRTLVWLGCDDQNIAKDAFALILEANAYFADLFLKAGRSVYNMEPFTKPYPICMDEGTWLGVAKVFRFPWFGRVWTVQEAAIAEKCCMFWGSVSIDIADVLELSIWIETKPDFQDVLRGIVEQFPTFPSKRIALYFYYNIHQPERWQQSRSGLAYLATTFFKEKPFWALLMEARPLEASDPRDHVYAFLGCSAAITSAGRTFVEADYTPSIDDLNLRLTYALMEESAEAPFIFSAVTHNSRERLMGDMHPSWLPVWHVAGEYRPKIAEPTYWFQAGGATELFTATQYGENGLSIIRVARPGDQEAVMEVQERKDAIWVRRAFYDLGNASVFLTRDGRIGLAPLGDLVEVGDVCCVIFGATVPFLLTPAEEGRHKLVSDCYIHGVMNGEIMEQFGESDLSKHRIVLE
ncbi:uncharacterized protein J4E88_005865 [Alternaria novae-zelandiae]|uniref:uncharacterized protein n=1 Tax=Alternaria novae-zelandiae TaxID=430562 RepID=UPI0020C3EACE|nr:uncharacterized protein J4E88_005865 [Alternaria novae-zelandiae]KAI4679975.1 hypothetical protein J4E88_005865 [Alternaria novae-zelandiae]